jgi:nitrogen fixation protein NifX
MKVAFATQDNVHINAHFGWAKQVAVYDVSSEGYHFLEIVEFGGNLKEDGNEDKLVPKIEAVADCTIVYVSAIGGSAASRLLQNKITPLKVEQPDDEITNVLQSLVKTLGNPPPWLRKTLQPKVKSFDFEEEEISLTS